VPSNVQGDTNLTRSRAKRYGRLLRLHGVKANGGKDEKAVASKRKSRASIAKAAEMKRRKIEGNHNDPFADDGDSDRPIKREVVVKQERSSFSVLSSPWNLPSSQQQSDGSQSYSTGSSWTGLQAQSATSRIKIEEDSDNATMIISTASSSAGYDADDERIFEDFCTSDLFESGDDASSSPSNEALVVADGQLVERNESVLLPGESMPTPARSLAAIRSLNETREPNRLCETSPNYHVPAQEHPRDFYTPTTIVIASEESPELVVVLD
jgi:hypothetical protein